MIRQILSIGIVSIGFAAVAFFFLPRDQSVWHGSQMLSFERPGNSRNVNLDQRNRIYLSYERAMKVSFTGIKGSTIRFDEDPYFRGMPLPNLIIENGQTSWEAPYERVYNPGMGTLPAIRNYRRYVFQEVILSPSNDPLLFSAFPPMRTSQTPVEVETSDVLSLLNRTSKFESTVSWSEFKYEVVVPILQDGNLFEAFPYRDGVKKTTLTESQNKGDYRWLTHIDKDRYPGLVAESDRIAKSAGKNHLKIARALTQHLANEDQYKYTLDFTEVDWTEGVDRIEDFFVNKKIGHCEFYASALTLMLRSQGIPARLVVGYHGGDYNSLEGYYDVLQKHAHAWVEVYIAPRYCPRDWLRRSGQANSRGAWLRLDATPASNDNNSDTDNQDNALGIAKDFWNSYVMGLDAEKQQSSFFESFVRKPLKSVGQFFTFDYWRFQWTMLRSPRYYTSAIFYLIVGGILILAWSIVSRFLLRKRENESQARAKKPLFQRMLGKAISIVAPRLGRWVAGDMDRNTKIVGFYQRFSKLMQQHGLQRNAAQTQREFGNVVSAHFAQQSETNTIQSYVDFLIEKFYLVRFSPSELSDADLEKIEASLDKISSMTETQPVVTSG